MQKTVFIVGAGASKEVGLPIGDELTQTIAEKLNFHFEFGHQQQSGSTIMAEAIRFLGNKTEKPKVRNEALYKAANIIKKGMPLAPSIDNFIHAYQGNEAIEHCAKMVIVESILEAERGSKLYFKMGNINDTPDYSAFSTSWFVRFFRLLVEAGTLQEVQERLNSLTFVVFNYDRCLEFFLFQALKTYYHLNDTQAAEIVNQICILHPYGTVGGLPWQSKKPSANFGAIPSGQELTLLAQGIRTFTEGIDNDHSDIREIRQRVSNANRFVFLGFAFRSINLDLLLPSSLNLLTADSRKVFATAFGVAPSDQEAMRNDMVGRGGMHHSEIHIEDVSCGDLFARNQRGLAFA